MCGCVHKWIQNFTSIAIILCIIGFSSLLKLFLQGSWCPLSLGMLVILLSKMDTAIKENKKQYYIIISLSLHNSLDKSNVKFIYFLIKPIISKLQVHSEDQVLLLPVDILCLIRHLSPAQASFQLFLLLPKYSFTNLLYKLQLPTGLPAGGENC